jgi:hypothetical protein
VRWDALAASSTCAEPVQAELDPEAIALPERQRAVLVLHDVDGWPADEVCTALEVSTGNQRVLLHRPARRYGQRCTRAAPILSWREPVTPCCLIRSGVLPAGSSRGQAL